MEEFLKEMEIIVWQVLNMESFREIRRLQSLQQIKMDMQNLEIWKRATILSEKYNRVQVMP